MVMIITLLQLVCKLQIMILDRVTDAWGESCARGPSKYGCADRIPVGSTELSSTN